MPKKKLTKKQVYNTLVHAYNTVGVATAGDLWANLPREIRDTMETIVITDLLNRMDVNDLYDNYTLEQMYDLLLKHYKIDYFTRK